MVETMATHKIRFIYSINECKSTSKAKFTMSILRGIHNGYPENMVHICHNVCIERMYIENMS